MVVEQAGAEPLDVVAEDGASPPDYRALRDFFEHGAVALHWVGPDGTVLWANQTELDLLGYTHEEYVGRHIAHTHADADVIDDILTRLRRGETIRNYPARLRAKDGAIKHVLITSSVRWEDGRFVHTRCFTVDVTDRVRAEEEARRHAERLTLLGRASELLAASLDYAATLEHVARLAVPALADWCIVDVLEGDWVRGGAWQPRIERVAVAAADPAKQAVLEEVRRRYPPTWDSPQPAARALRTGQPAFFAAFTEESLAQTVRDETHHALLHVLAPTSAIAVPLVARGRTLGALTFAWAESGRHYDAADIRLAEDLASRCALAVDNARLYQEAREREAAQAALNAGLRELAEARDRAFATAEAARRRMAFLAQASEELAASLDYETTLGTVAHLAVPQLADWCAVDVLGEDGSIRRLATAHVEPAKVALALEVSHRYPPEPRAPYGVPAVLRTGRPELHPEIPDDLLVAAARDAEHLALLRQVGLTAAMVVPMTARERVLGALTLAWAESGRTYDEADLAVAQDLARRAAVAVDNARLYRAGEQWRARLELAQQAGQIGTFEWDVETGTVAWTPEMEALHGLERGGFGGRYAHWLERLHPDDRPRVERDLAGAVCAGSDLDAEFRVIWPDGTVRWLIAKGRVYAGEPTGGAPSGAEQPRPAARMVGVSLDVTARKEAEAALREAIRVRDDFLAAASHDLKNPLAAVRGTAQLLRRTMDRTGTVPPDRLAPALDSLQRSVDRMTAQINELLDVARLRLGRPLPLDRTPTDLVALVCEAVALEQATTERHQIRLDAAAPALVGEWDAPRLARMVANLLANAVKYSPNGGDILVTVTCESTGAAISDASGSAAAPADAADGKTWAVLRVQDHGIGIPAGDLPRIFDRFARAANAGWSEGTGIGLSAAKHIVEQHGGTLAVESEEGKGSTFAVRLPLSPPAALPQMAAAVGER